MKIFLSGNAGLVAAIACMIALSVAVPAQAAPGASLTQLRQQIEQDRNRELPLLMAALAQQPALAPQDRMWVLVQLGTAAKKANNLEQAVTFFKLAQKEAGSVPIAQVHVARHLINVLNDLDKRDEALAHYTKVAAMLATLGGTFAGMQGKLEAAEAWRAGGTTLTSLGRLPEAMELQVRALAIFDAHDGQRKGQAECLNQIANLYYKSGNVAAALREVQRGIDIAEQANISDILSRLYMRKAVFMSSKGEEEESYRALLRARNIAIAENNAFNLAVIATNLADVALQRKDYHAALRYVAEAMPLVEKSGDREALLICLINKGIAMNRLRRPEGLDLIKRAIDEFTVTPGKKDVAADIQGLLAAELAHNGAFEQAYAAAMDFKQRTDEVRQDSDQKRIIDSAARYEADKKQRQIELLEQEQRAQRRMQWLWVLAGGLGLLTAAILVVSRIYLKRAYRKVSDMSLSDPLTGLRNRRYLASRIESDLAEAVRHRATQERTRGRAGEIADGGDADIVFIMIDMDHFKSVNDAHGHAAGDAVLKQFAAILLEQLRDADTVVRWGGEEFLIVARQACCADIHLLAERVRARVAAHDFDIGNGTVLHKTCSIGYASYPPVAAGQDQPRWEEVVAMADQCLYAAKAGGRNMWVGVVPTSTPAMPARGDVRLGIRQGAVRVEHSAGRELVWPPGHEDVPQADTNSKTAPA